MASKDIYVIICEHVTLQGKGDFAGVIKVRTLRGGDYPQPSGPTESHGPLKMREPFLGEFGERRRYKNRTTISKTQCCWL